MAVMQWKVTGQGSPIVLVPGGLTGWLSWEPHVERLSPSRRVVQVQLLNVQWGLEDQPLPRDYSVKTESQALAAALDEAGLEGAIDVAAWSFGAMVTLDFALDNPHRVRTLTLIEPPAFWVLRGAGSLDAEAQRSVATLEGLRGDISEEQLEHFLDSVGLAPPMQSVRQLPQWPLWVRHRQSLRNSPAVLAFQDDAARLGAFQKPTLLVKGTGSARFLHQIIDTLADQLPNARVVEMPAGHGPHLVSMGRFLEEMQAFQSSKV